MQTSLGLLKKDMSQIDNIITIYLEELHKADALIGLSGKRIDIANSEQSGWSNYYSGQTVEVKHLKEYMQMKLEEVHGNLWVKYTDKMQKILTQKDKEQYIKRDPEFLAMYEQYLKIEELYDQFKRIDSSFSVRGYALNNLTRLITSEANDWVIP